MPQIRIKAEKIHYDPKTNEYLLDSSLERFGTWMNVDIYLDPNSVQDRYAFQAALDTLAARLMPKRGVDY